MSEHDQPIAPDLLDRNFQPPAKNQGRATRASSSAGR
jgi:hypothetical protein